MYRREAHWVMEIPMLKNYIKAVGMLFVGIVLGTLLLILVYCLPVSERNSNAVASIEILNTEGWYPVMPLAESFEGTIKRINKGGILDNFTDSIMISAAASDANGRPWYQAMKMESNMMEQGYSYYWHGYVTVLRPLLLLFDYGEIRVLNGLIQLLLVIVLFSLIKERKGTAWALVSLSVYGLLFPLTLVFSLQYSWVFYIEIVVSIILICFEEFWKKQHNIYYLFLVAGMLTSYFDLLTYPLITWGIPIIWWIALDDRKNTEMNRIKDVVFSGIFWILGYAGMWAGKWFMGELIIKEPIISTAWNEVLYRAGALEGTDGCEASHLNVIMKNLDQCDSVQYLFILCAWSVWFAFHFWKNRSRMQTQKALAFFVVALSSFAWYIVLHNHTYVHASFTYRIFTILFTAILGTFVSGTEENVREKDDNVIRERRFLLRYVIPLGILFFALGAASFDRQTIWQHNGESENTSVLLENGQIVEQKFVPMYRDVTALQLGIGAEGSLKGNFMITVSQEDNLLFARKIPAADVGNVHFHNINLGLKLKAGESYLIKLSLEDDEETRGIVIITTEGDYTLTEFDAVSINGCTRNAQMMGGLTYRVFPDKSKFILDLLTIGGFLAMAYLGILNISDAMIKHRHEKSEKLIKQL